MDEHEYMISTVKINFDLSLLKDIYVYMMCDWLKFLHKSTVLASLIQSKLHSWTKTIG